MPKTFSISSLDTTAELWPAKDVTVPLKGIWASGLCEMSTLVVTIDHFYLPRTTDKDQLDCHSSPTSRTPLKLSRTGHQLFYLQGHFIH